MAAPAKGMRIAELARRTETPKETIHYYLKEGLLDRPTKTSRNMAYYDERHVEQLRLIKRLRTDSYLPIAAIKKVLAEERTSGAASRLDLSADLFGAGARADVEPLTAEALAARAGLAEDRLRTYAEAGVLRPRTTPGGPRYDHADLRAAEILAEAEAEAGPAHADLVAERFAILERHMRALAEEEVAHFFAHVIPDHGSAQTLELLRAGRGPIGRYLTLARGRHLRREVDAVLPTLEAQARDPEPFFWPLLDPAAARDRVEALRAASAARPRDTQVKLQWVHQHLACFEGVEALEVLGGLSRRARAEASVRRLEAEATLWAQRWDEAVTRLEALRAERGAPDPWLEAMWGAAVLVRIRDRLGDVRSGADLVADLSKAFVAFEAARAAAESPYVRARVHLLIGRIEVGAPSFLGTAAQGRADLAVAAEALAALADDPEDPAVAPLAHGARALWRANIERLSGG